MKGEQGMETIETILETIIFICAIIGVYAFCNGEKLRKRVNVLNRRVFELEVTIADMKGE